MVLTLLGRSPGRPVSVGIAVLGEKGICPLDRPLVCPLGAVSLEKSGEDNGAVVGGAPAEFREDDGGGAFRR